MPDLLHRPGLPTLAYAKREGAGPTIVFLPGYGSDMEGSKAVALDAWAEAQGHAMLRLDYRGCGQSEGVFGEATLDDWRDDALDAIDTLTQGPIILVGSSMGGWLALLLMRALRHRRQPATTSVAGLVLIAPAVDFTEELMWKRFAPAIREELEQTGVWRRPSEYSPEPYMVTRQLIEEGRHHLLLGGMIETGCPVRILQGVEDPDVPWRHAVELVSRLASDDVVLTLVKDGDHRLSRPEDIDRLIRAVAEF
jgi:pimeloyl-ACP methyl ester carboxylesterase